MHFQRVEIVTLCVYVCACVLFWFLFPRQAATTSYPALIYFRAVHRNGTNQEGRNTHTQKQQQQGKKKSKLQALEQMSNFSPAVTSNNSCSFLFRQFQLLPVFCLFFSPSRLMWPSTFFFFVHTDSLINKTLKMSSKKVVLTGRTIASVAVWPVFIVHF